MGLDRDMLAQLRHLLRPIATRVANTVARAVVQLADDSRMLQVLQVGVLADETVEGAEHHQPYGFSSVPLAGAEAVLVFPNGDRSHPLAVAVSDRRYRPKGGTGGEVSMYHYLGAKVTMLANGDIELHPGAGGNIKLQPAAGGKVVVDDGSGAVALPTMADFNGIVSILNSSGSGAGTAVPLAVATYQTAHPTWPVGTAVLKGK